MRVLVFGDSITQGFWDESGGWAERLKMHYWEQYFAGENSDPPTVFNLGVSSNSSGDVRERLLPEVTARSDGQELAVVIAVGINDARIKGESQFSTVDQYRENMEYILQQAQTITRRVLVVGSTACDESVTNPVAWGDTSYTNDRIWEFERALRDVSSAQNIPHVKLFELFEDKQLLDDGLHPNSAGHELIYRQVIKYLDDLLAA